MVEIIEVKTKREQRRFMQFPNDLYRGNDCYVPMLWMDEKQIFDKNYTYNETCDTVYYNAYRDGKMVGRISGIVQKAANEKYNEKRVRFTRFDTINDPEVAKALFDAVEAWGKSKGMDTICGPLGFSDMEREGLLIEGFDQLAVYEEQYNADYYQTLIENLGYEKEVDWTESKITVPEGEDGRMFRIGQDIMKRYNLHLAEAKNPTDFLNKYGDDLFKILDMSYEGLYGTVPFTDGMKKLMIKNFKMVVDLKRMSIIFDEDNNPVCIGIAIPSIAKAVQKSEGRLTPGCLFRLLKAIKHPDIIDLCLIGVDPSWMNRGISVVFAGYLMEMLKDPNIKWAETLLNLENNYPIQNFWSKFGRENHKRRRAYVKKLS